MKIFAGNGHKEIYDQFKIIFQEEGLDRIDERLHVLEAFLGLEDHPTAAELSLRLKSEGFNFSQDFVSENLKIFSKFGFAIEKNFKDQASRYEHLHLGKHHDHLICIRCGKILEFFNTEIEALQTEVAAREGFHDLQHRMEIYGLCSDCFGKREPLMPLTMVSPGERVRIEAFKSGRRMTQRLIEMGLNVGTEVHIINKATPGPFLIAVGGARLGIGHGVAHKIMVRLV